MSAAVTDGVTLGHPCCSEHECKIPLQTVKEEYCALHDDLNTKCCIKGCQRLRETGFRTCMLTVHRKQETDRAFTKRRRPASIYKRQEHVPRSKGVFSRKWTHNEQLMVRPCGIIVGRATFYSSESMSAVKVAKPHPRRDSTPKQVSTGLCRQCISSELPRNRAAISVFRQRMWIAFLLDE